MPFKFNAKYLAVHVRLNTVATHNKHTLVIITTCKRSLGKVMFYTCLSVILFTGGGGRCPWGCGPWWGCYFFQNRLPSQNIELNPRLVEANKLAWISCDPRATWTCARPSGGWWAAPLARTASRTGDMRGAEPPSTPEITRQSLSKHAVYSQQSDVINFVQRSKRQIIIFLGKIRLYLQLWPL